MRKPRSFQYHPLALALGFSALVATGGLISPTIVQAQQPHGSAQTANAEAQTFDIPAGPLSQVLSRFAGAAGVALSFDAARFSDIQSPGLKGRYTLEQGFATLLEGTGTLAVRQSNGDYVLQNSGPLALDPIQVGGADQGSAFAPVDGYAATHSYTGTKTDTPILETPMSVQVVTRDVIDDQGAQRLEDVYRNVSGVVESGNTLNAQSFVLPVIRGFETPTILRNGVRATTVGTVDLVNVERVEVLKGPASILFGALEPGGVLNYVTKRPQAEARHELRQEFGSYEHFRTSLDSTGALSRENNLLYRLNAAYTDTESFRDDLDLERVTVAPSLLWLPGDQTEVLLDLSYTREEVPLDSGIPLGQDGEPLVQDDTFFSDPSLDGRDLEDWFASIELEHRFNDVWTLRNKLQYHRAEPRNQAIRNRGVSGEPGQEELGQRFQDEDRVDEEYQWVTDLLADFSTGGVEHQLLVGLDISRQELEFDRFRQNLPAVPISDNPQVRFTPPPDRELTPAFRSETDWVAVYFQDQISLLRDGRLKLLLGGRFDAFDEEDKLDGISSDESEFTGRAGVLFQANDWFSPYASVTESFLPQGPGTQDREGNTLAPETGIQFELGAKFDFFDESLLVTAALFEVEKEDVALFDFDFFQQTGDFAWLPGVDQRSRGFELDVNGQLSRGLSLTANLAYTDAEETSNRLDPSREGATLGNVPEWSARTWLSYDFAQDSAWDGLGLGLGLRYEGERFTQFDEAIEFDEFLTVDAGVWYRYPLSQGRSLKAQLNLRNLTDERFITRASDQSIAHPGAPFTVQGSLSLHF